MSSHRSHDPSEEAAEAVAAHQSQRSVRGRKFPWVEEEAVAAVAAVGILMWQVTLVVVAEVEVEVVVVVGAVEVEVGAPLHFQQNQAAQAGLGTF